MKLKELLATVPNISLSISHPALDLEVKGLATNSHACQPGDLFLGMPGTRVDGGDFWQGAIASFPLFSGYLVRMMNRWLGAIVSCPVNYH